MYSELIKSSRIKCNLNEKKSMMYSEEKTHGKMLIRQLFYAQINLFAKTIKPTSKLFKLDQQMNL